jgi:hypothetical protein
MSIGIKALFGGLAALALAAVPASAVTVTYSFTNIVGNVSGTVFGHIDGLVDNATSAATAVWVDSYPAMGAAPASFNVFNWTGFTSDENSFTMVGGVVTAAHFHADGTTYSGLDRIYLDSQCNCSYNTGHTNFLSVGNGDGQFVWNVGNFNAADGLLIPGADRGVPEPAAWAMLIAGFGLVGAAARRRKAVVAA